MRNHRTGPLRAMSALTVFGLFAMACGTGGGSTGVDDPEGTTTVTEAEAPAAGDPAGMMPVGPSALDDPLHPDFPDPLIPVADIISGGPPPDGIPSIDEPVFIPVAGAETIIEDDEPVVYLERGGEAKAYPVRVLIWHEIVNDEIGGVPVAVTYCPLCNSAITFVREVRGVVTTFGTSGRLYASALVMYDRASESLWTQFDGRAVVGLLTGETVESIPSPLLSWADFRTTFPDGVVLDPAQTGFDRAYGTNPYVGYDDPDAKPFLFLGDADGRARAMQRIVGVQAGEEAVAWTLESISAGEASATNAEVGDLSVVILWKAGQSTALEGRSVFSGRDVGSVGVFSSRVDGRTLTFRADGDGYVDDETGSVWTVTGSAVAGPMAGVVLERISHLDTFWFAWAAYRPDTVLIEE